ARRVCTRARAGVRPGGTLPARCRRREEKRFGGSRTRSWASLLLPRYELRRAVGDLDGLRWKDLLRDREELVDGGEVSHDACFDDVRVHGATGELLAFDDDAQRDLAERVAPLADGADLEIDDAPGMPRDLVDRDARRFHRTIAQGRRGVGATIALELHRRR